MANLIPQQQTYVGSPPPNINKGMNMNAFFAGGAAITAAGLAMVGLDAYESFNGVDIAITEESQNIPQPRELVSDSSAEFQGQVLGKKLRDGYNELSEKLGVELYKTYEGVMGFSEGVSEAVTGDSEVVGTVGNIVQTELKEYADIITPDQFPEGTSPNFTSGDVNIDYITGNGADVKEQILMRLDNGSVLSVDAKAVLEISPDELSKMTDRSQQIIGGFQQIANTAIDANTVEWQQGAMIAGTGAALGGGAYVYSQVNKPENTIAAASTAAYESPVIVNGAAQNIKHGHGF